MNTAMRTPSPVPGTLLKTGAFLLAVAFFTTTVFPLAQAEAQRADGDSGSVESTSLSESSGSSSDNLQVVSLDGPRKVYVGEPATYRALLEKDDVDLTYQWQFGEKKIRGQESGSGADVMSTHLSEQSELAATHTYGRPGTYTVALSASSDTETIRETITVTVTRSSPGETPSDSTRPTRIAKTDGAERERVAQDPNIQGDRSGQWGIVVASLRDARKAEIVADRYRRQFDTQSTTVEIMTADFENSRRFRVVVGQYENDRDAQDAILTHEDRLPVRAWTVRFQERFLSQEGI